MTKNENEKLDLIIKAVERIHLEHKAILYLMLDGKYTINDINRFFKSLDEKFEAIVREYNEK